MNELECAHQDQETLEPNADSAPENAIARILDEWVCEVPKDLYIPPDALEVFLEVFEGPLDLLLYLIRKHNLDILDIPVAVITKQYLAYIEIMQFVKIEVIADYLEMAAVLTEIKSRMLLPRNKVELEEEEDPRARLAQKLQEYEQMKLAAQDIDALPRKERDIFRGSIAQPESNIPAQMPELDFPDLLMAFKDVIKRLDLNSKHSIEREALSVRERMTIILSTLETDKFMEFSCFFYKSEGRAGLIVTFIAILELVRDCNLELIQSEPYAPIYVRLTQ
ncbi:MAG: segregation/condensation protein A [Francisellaceae bacterium]|nr:segregation/condensation protein A [Francisellaceae bacterium]MBT6206810.1 segregation/condensation protein A [Francisellaceae bacterium]